MHPDQQQYDLNNKMAQWDSAIARAATDHAAHLMAQSAEKERVRQEAPVRAPSPRRVAGFFAWLSRRSVPPATSSR
jgi:hypothetical protein